MDEKFDSAAQTLWGKVQSELLALPCEIKRDVSEIRLRADGPLMLTVNNKSAWVCDKKVWFSKPSKPITVTKQQLAQQFIALCDDSVYSHENELREGYISLKQGHRAGVAGRLAQNGMVIDVCSINIRIAREIFGSADFAVNEYDGGGLLIAGPPSSGKTTILRDFIRQLSQKQALRISLIDTRGEIAAVSGGVPTNTLGDTVDVLCGCEKAMGIERAVRTLNPQLVAFDEIGRAAEARAVVDALNAGTATVATIHAGSKEELFNKESVKILLDSGAITKILLLSKKIGSIPTVIKV